MTQPLQCYHCRAPAEPGKSLCARHIAARREAEQRRQMRAVTSGSCIGCGKAIEPWRLAEGLCKCALCSRTAKSQYRRCSRCAALGHSVASCQEPPHGYEGPFRDAQGEERYQLQRRMTETDRALKRAELDQLLDQLARVSSAINKARYELEHEVVIVRYSAALDDHRETAATTDAIQKLDGR